MDLIAALKAKQGGMSQAAFARILGITPSALCLIYSGQRQIGEATGRRLVRVYPDLRWLVTGYIMDKAEKVLERAPKGQTTESIAKPLGGQEKPLNRPSRRTQKG